MPFLYGKPQMDNHNYDKCFYFGELSPIIPLYCGACVIPARGSVY